MGIDAMVPVGEHIKQIGENYYCRLWQGRGRCSGTETELRDRLVVGSCYCYSEELRWRYSVV